MTWYLLVLNLLVLIAGLGLPYLMSLRVPVMEEFNAAKIRFWNQPNAYRQAAEKAARPAPQKGLCLEVEGLNQARYQEMHGYLKTAGLEGSGQCGYRFDKELAWWVFWPPEYEEARRDKVIKSILAAGVKDVMPINQGAMAQSYSLGVFKNEVQANQFRDKLRGKGLDKVEHGPRPNMDTGYLGCQSSEAARLDGFKAGLPAWVKEAEERMCWPAGR